MMIYRTAGTRTLIQLKTTIYASDSIASTTEDWSNNATISDGTSLANLINCESQSTWINDGFCDDETNIESCQFDGGDCCLEVIVDLGCINVLVS